jgi:hypothetical protein
VTADVEPDDDDDTQHDGEQNRSTPADYLGLGRDNVQARKTAGLSDTFEKFDPLLMEFSQFLRTT